MEGQTLLPVQSISLFLTRYILYIISMKINQACFVMLCCFAICYFDCIPFISPILSTLPTSGLENVMPSVLGYVVLCCCGYMSIIYILSTSFLHPLGERSIGLFFLENNIFTSLRKTSKKPDYFGREDFALLPISFSPNFHLFFKQ